MGNTSHVLPEAPASESVIFSSLSCWLLASVAVVLFYLLLEKRPSKPLPPGPRGIPLLGNALQLNGHLWVKLTEWAGIYGPVVHFTAFGKDVIALNTLEAAFDILDGKANITSQRSDIIMVKLMTKDLWISTMQADSTWSRQRRVLHTGLRSVGSYSGWLPREAATLAIDMARSPCDWRKHIEVAVHAGSTTVAYGDGLDRDAMPRRARRMYSYFQYLVAAQTPGAYVVELLPWLNHLPGFLAPWKKEGEEVFNAANTLLHEMYKEASESLSSCSPSVLKATADAEDLSPIEKVWLVGQITIAAVTNQGPLSFWLMAMVLYPKTQQLAQKEIDSVVGRERPPSWEDYGKMPYLQAMLREVLRWRPTSPLGLIHVASQDIPYKGYTIPKGAVLLPNAWAINRSPSNYGSDADDFNPSRFLNPDTKELLPPLANTKGEGQVVFGFGRRLCPGRPIAHQLMATYVMTVLWALKIEPVERPCEKRAWDPHGCLDEGVFVGAPEFPCKTSERFKGALKMLEKLT